MSLAQHTARLRRMCRRCGGPTGRAAVCAKCDPTKPTTAHADKYAAQRHQEDEVTTMIPNVGSLYARVTTYSAEGEPRTGVARVVGWVHRTDDYGRDGWLPVITCEDSAAAVPVPADAEVSYASTARQLAAGSDRPWWYRPYTANAAEHASPGAHHVLSALDATAGTNGDVTLSDLRAVLDELPDDERPTRSEFLAALAELDAAGRIALDRSRAALLAPYFTGDEIVYREDVERALAARPAPQPTER